MKNLFFTILYCNKNQIYFPLSNPFPAFASQNRHFPLKVGKGLGRCPNIVRERGLIKEKVEILVLVIWGVVNWLGLSAETNSDFGGSSGS